MEVSLLLVVFTVVNSVDFSVVLVSGSVVDVAFIKVSVALVIFSVNIVRLVTKVCPVLELSVIFFVKGVDVPNVDVSAVEAVPLVEEDSVLDVSDNVDVVVVLPGKVPQSLLFSSSFNGQSTIPSQ